MKLDTAYHIPFILLFMFVAVFVGLMIYEMYAFNQQQDECIALGYQGATRGPSGLIYDYVCYIDIPHESGVGTERIYSGVIRDDKS